MLQTVRRWMGFGGSRFASPDTGPATPEAAESPAIPVAQAARYSGEVLERSERHIAGWVFNPGEPGARLPFEVRLGGEHLLEGRADKFWWGLAGAGFGDGRHGFWARFPRRLSPGDAARVSVWAGDVPQPLPLSPGHGRHYEPILHVAMDIVDNCNLRCPFCLYDYADTRTTHFMQRETLEAALRFLPYTRDGEFWFSCLHEPTLHPRIQEFVDLVPPELRRKLFYTTNLAKRMPAAYFDWLANDRLHHFNVSIESRDPALYERMRKGARFRNFQENWDMLTDALGRAEKPTRVRYIAMAYKSNLRELPELAKYLLTERRGWQVEIRDTYDVPHLAPGFREAEFLDMAEWDWLEDSLADLPSGAIALVRPPRVAPRPPDAGVTHSPAPPPAAAAPDRDGGHGSMMGPVMFRLSYDGTLKVVGIDASSASGAQLEQTLLTTNIRDIADPDTFLQEVACDHPKRG